MHTARAAGEPAILDSEVFDELAALGDTLDNGFLVGLVDQFLRETMSMLVELREAVHRGDVLSTRSIAHSLKGSSAQLGGLRLASCCDRLERLATSGDLLGLQTELVGAGTDYRALCELLTQRVSAAACSGFTP